MRSIPIKNFEIGPGKPLVVMCGPCVIENESHALKAAEALKHIFEEVNIHLIYKSSYDKANRSAYHSFRGPGLEEGLRILERIKREWDLPVVTDVHSPQEALQAGEVCDMVQIPAFLCRQTDLITAAARSKAVVSVKKGQFMAPWDMGNVVKKIEQGGNERIILVERGATFGYNNLVSDMRAIPLMQKFGYPVCFDATHSAQLPGGQGETSGGQREFIPLLAQAAIAAGANCLFMEAHPQPEAAKSDAATVLPFEMLPKLLPRLKAIYELIQHV